MKRTFFYLIISLVSVITNPLLATYQQEACEDSKNELHRIMRICYTTVYTPTLLEKCKPYLTGDSPIKMLDLGNYGVNPNDAPGLINILSIASVSRVILKDSWGELEKLLPELMKNPRIESIRLYPFLNYGEALIGVGKALETNKTLKELDLSTAYGNSCIYCIPEAVEALKCGLSLNTTLKIFKCDDRGIRKQDREDLELIFMYPERAQEKAGVEVTVPKRTISVKQRYILPGEGGL